jgi:hypothetical protein
MLRRIGSRLRGQKGTSLVEVLVAGLILVIGMIAISQLFTSGGARVGESEVRSVLTQVANQDIESIRALNYEDVGTINGDPAGTLAQDEDLTVSGVAVHLHREIKYWTDASYSGPYPANYRRVEVSVYPSSDPSDTIVVTTNVAGGAQGGTIDVTVTDVTGKPVPDAQITISNTHLVPNVNIMSSALNTDDNGNTFVPGLTPDSTAAYVVTATKEGYSTAVSSPSVVVDGSPYTVIDLTIDQLSNLNVSVVDAGGNPVTGMSMTITGPDSYSQDFVSASIPVSFNNIPYSTSTDPYIVTLLAGNGYSGQQQAVTLNPNSTQNVVFTATPVTTTTVGVTTTTGIIGSSSLNLKVEQKGNNWPVAGARVSLSPGGQVLTTNSSGSVFFSGLTNQTYTVVVTCPNYNDYRPIAPAGNIVITGATTATVYLTHD